MYRTARLSLFPRFPLTLSYTELYSAEKLAVYSVQPFRYSRRTYWLMAGRFVHVISEPFQSSLPTPARMARLPRRTNSVSGPAWSKLENAGRPPLQAVTHSRK